MTSRIFVIGPGHHDYAPAEAHGELVFILDVKANPFRTDEMMDDVERELLVNKFSIDDVLLLGGNPTLNAVAVAYVQSKFGRVRLLIYGAKNHDYVLRDVLVDGKVRAGTQTREELVDGNR